MSGLKTGHDCSFTSRRPEIDIWIGRERKRRTSARDRVLALLTRDLRL
jgi:hypothetical protein